MKKLLFAVTALSLGILLCACGGTKKTTQSKKDKSEIVMTVNPGTYASAPQIIELEVFNNTDNIAQFGADYTVEKYVDGKWSSWDFPEHFPVIMILYTLPPQKSEIYKINLFSDRVKYKPGLYRVAKNINIDEKSSVFHAEFIVK